MVKSYPANCNRESYEFAGESELCFDGRDVASVNAYLPATGSVPLQADSLYILRTHLKRGPQESATTAGGNPQNANAPDPLSPWASVFLSSETLARIQTHAHAHANAQVDANTTEIWVRCLRPPSAVRLRGDARYATNWKWFHSTHTYRQLEWVDCAVCTSHIPSRSPALRSVINLGLKFHFPF